jgi:hypothetical protein
MSEGDRRGFARGGRKGRVGVGGFGMMGKC